MLKCDQDQWKKIDRNLYTIEKLLTDRDSEVSGSKVTVLTKVCKVSRVNGSRPTD